MKNNILIEVSNRHIHLSREHIDALFGKNHQLKILKELSQPGLFAAEEQVTLIDGDKRLEHVRVIGPERDETQVEILKSDSIYLGIEYFLRHSGDIEGTPGVILEGPKGTVELEKGVIVARRHIHLAEDEAKELGVKDKQLITIKVPGTETVLHNVLVRVNPDSKLAVHIDKDDGETAMIKGKTYGQLIIKQIE